MPEQSTKKIPQTFRSLFLPSVYNPESSLQKLNQFGGVLGVINHLRTCHRRGLSSNDTLDHEKRRQQYGVNKEPPTESIFKKSLMEQRDFVMNFLFYLLTLKICVKVLLLRDEWRGMQPLGQGKVFHFEIWGEMLSFVLLIAIILLKALVSVEYFKMNQDQRKYSNRKIDVKRDGEKIQIQQQNLMVGDILLIKSNDTVKVDGIMLSSKKLQVNQAHTILKTDIKKKKQVWVVNPEDPHQNDPFILSGSYILTGSAELLVCTVGPNCSFRMNKQDKQYYQEYTPLISQIHMTMKMIENLSKILTGILATYTSIQYLIRKYNSTEIAISWQDLLHILQVYCCYIGLIFFVQGLKIVPSLQFFIQTNRSSKFYRVKDKKSLQKMSGLDILFIDMQALSMQRYAQRQQTKYTLGHLDQISQLNNFMQIKIICPQSRQTIEQMFGTDLQSHTFYQPNQQAPHSLIIKSLIQATFLTRTNTNNFVKNLLPIYSSLSYSIGYIYCTPMQIHRQVPVDTLLINFEKLMVNSWQLSRPASNASNFWLKLQNKIFMQQLLCELFNKARTYEALYQTYLTLYVNNIVVFISLCYFSTTTQVINLSWYLIIIIAHRYLFFTIYNKLTLQRQPTTKKQSLMLKILKFNLYLLPFYLYTVSTVHQPYILFIFFLVNAIGRIELVLWGQVSQQRREQLARTGRWAGVVMAVGMLRELVMAKGGLAGGYECVGGLLMVFVGFGVLG